MELSLVLICLQLGPVPRQIPQHVNLPCVSGVYPHLNIYNDENECGIGTVVVWQGDLWFVTYAPHAPGRSTDRLYRLTKDFVLRPFPDSVGGTHANRMIHRETNQLLIGPYVVDAQGRVRVLPRERLFGRLTGTARHLHRPGRYAYYATMEAGLYEVDLVTLHVRCLIRDRNRGAPPGGISSRLLAAHGKGLYSGQGRVVYVANGLVGGLERRRAGALAEWTGQGDWKIIRHGQFAEVTGPGGIEGNKSPDDPIWALGADDKSVLLGLLDGGRWSFFRLPKASRTYDGHHGWHTEWPRIRSIGEPNWLATMHGTFWSFPPTFRREHTGGIRPRSTYLRVVVDFCRWNNRVVFACNDSARSAFLNVRPIKAAATQAVQSHSNLWFLRPEQIDRLGPVAGGGAVWLGEDVAAGEVSDPFLFAGYPFRQLWLAHESPNAVPFRIEVDRKGTGQWETLAEVTVEPGRLRWMPFEEGQRGEWIRIRALREARAVTAHFEYRTLEQRTERADSIFQGLARRAELPERLGLLRSTAHDRLTIVASSSLDGADAAVYELDEHLAWHGPRADGDVSRLVEQLAQPERGFTIGDSSVVVVERGVKYRLPLHPQGRRRRRKLSPFARPRVCREVVTERDLLHLDGTFYELPAVTAGGVAKLRPIATHDFWIHDYCGHKGLLFMTGLDGRTRGGRILRSPDGLAAVWVGVIDDLWRLGKPRGVGGPWVESRVPAGVPSDPYLFRGYDGRSVRISADRHVRVRLEFDLDGSGTWWPYRSFSVEPGKALEYQFPRGMEAQWIRAVCDRDAVVTVWFAYE